MADTIKLLETIGSDASLRYASPDELKGALKQAQASVELTMAVATGDIATLRVELRIERAYQVLETHAPGHEGDDEEESDPPKPERRQPDEPSPPPPAKKPG